MMLLHPTCLRAISKLPPGSYSALGFTETWRDRGWMILKRRSLTLEFFRILTLIRWQARLVVAFGWTTWMPSTRFAKTPEFPKGAKGNRGFHPPEAQSWGRRMGAFVDPDGTLVRLIQN